MTLQAFITQLAQLARDTEADFVHQIQLEIGGGAVVVIHWTPSGDDLPKEAHAYFKDDNQFSFAWVIDPTQWLHSVEEGLEHEVADDTARRLVENESAVVSYLKGDAYPWVKPRCRAAKEA